MGFEKIDFKKGDKRKYKCSYKGITMLPFLSEYEGENIKTRRVEKTMIFLYIKRYRKY